MPGEVLSQDFVCNQHVQIPFSVMFDSDVMCRQSQDSNIVQCKYGKQFIEMCITQLVLRYPSGKYTCPHYNTSSVVDYGVG